MTVSVNRHLQAQMQGDVLVMTVTAISIEGEEIARQLRDEMLAALAASGARKVVVDFHETRFISSAAFRPLLSLRRKLQAANGAVVLCGLTPSIGDIFYTTRMISPDGTSQPMFEMEVSLPAAIARLERGGSKTG